MNMKLMMIALGVVVSGQHVCAMQGNNQPVASLLPVVQGVVNPQPLNVNIVHLHRVSLNDLTNRQEFEILRQTGGMAFAAKHQQYLQARAQKNTGY